MGRKISPEQEEREKKEIAKNREKRPFIGHAVRDDPNIDKEDSRPIEKKKKPDVSINWTGLKEWLDS